MVVLSFDLENCYGIRRLRHDVRLDRKGCAAIYAPNGSMKTSLAKSLQDLSKGAESLDQVFPDRVTSCARLIRWVMIICARWKVFWRAPRCAGNCEAGS